ncbi:hypothetical protein LCGC14_2602750, partial [marine sediment metagenome]
MTTLDDRFEEIAIEGTLTKCDGGDFSHDEVGELMDAFIVFVETYGLSFGGGFRALKPPRMKVTSPLEAVGWLGGSGYM